jgi:hypothetical protein
MNGRGLDPDGTIAREGALDRVSATFRPVVEAALDAAFPHIDGVGIGLLSTRTVPSDLERHDLGFFVACLCTPLLGEDLAPWLTTEYTTVHGEKTPRP